MDIYIIIYIYVNEYIYGDVNGYINAYQWIAMIYKTWESHKFINGGSFIAGKTTTKMKNRGFCPY